MSCVLGLDIQDIEDFGEKKSVDNKQHRDDHESDVNYVKPFTVRNSDEILSTIVKEIMNQNIKERSQMQAFVRKLQRKYKISLSNSELLFSYKMLCLNEDFKFDNKYNELLQARTFRSQSGVMVFTLVLSPYPNGQDFSCAYNCKYCPLEPGQPRSYMKEEPGVARANRHNFDPIMQFRDRGFSYIANGHKVDKAEVIILGGTWSSFPESYKKKFITEMYYAANTFFDNSDVKKLREIKSLEEEMKINESTDCKIIGVTIETRPDCVNKKELRTLREYGVTRVQIGIQHIDDRILDRVDRRCHSKHAIRAIKMLKTHCFKVDCHWMPDLPCPVKNGVDPHKKDLSVDDIDWSVDMYKLDKQMFETIINSEEWQTDQWKIYPFEVVPWTKLEEEYKNNLHKPYSMDIVDKNTFIRKGVSLTKLHELLMYVKSIVPVWIRLNRIIRDIPSQHIIAGNNDVSMRQSLETFMKTRGLKCKCIRCREVKKRNVDYENATFFNREYKASDGVEHFLSYETPDEEILFGFLRLRFDTEETQSILEFNELKGCALIRELHVYGQTTAVDKNSNSEYNPENNPKKETNEKKYQHIGFGKKLVLKAFELAKLNGYKKIAVISGNGVKNYYKKFGFVDSGLFMVKIFEEYEQNEQNEENEQNDKINESTNKKNKYYLNMTVKTIILVLIIFSLKKIFGCISIGF